MTLKSSNDLLIFVKNLDKGKVKTRLAKTIGDHKALMVYKLLLKYTKEISQHINCQKTVLYNNIVEEKDIFPITSFNKEVQNKGDLGIKMFKAFEKSFKNGSKKTIVIGSDCYEIKSEHIELAFSQLDKYDVVIGPAEDGGYYLLGLKNVHTFLFNNKSWSSSNLLDETIADILKNGLSYKLLPTLTDIDTFEDLKKFKSLIENIEKE